jgi:hypothetical protein
MRAPEPIQVEPRISAGQDSTGYVSPQRPVMGAIMRDNRGLKPGSEAIRLARNEVGV